MQKWRFGVFCCFLFALVHAKAGYGLADGEAPVQIADESVFGSAVAAGNTLMLFDGVNNANFALEAGGSDININMPPAAQVVRAFLFWAGSLDPFLGVDQNVDFTLPNNTFINDLDIQIPQPGETLSTVNRCTSRPDAGDVAMGFFYCRREVTSILQSLGPGGASGIYNVQDVDALPGDCNTNISCQAAFAGWALVVIWEETASVSVRSDVVLYDSFFAVDEQNIPFFDSGLSPFFNLSGFEVGEDAAVDISFMGFEGDDQLGVPPQDNPLIDPQLFCPTCDDFIEVVGGAGTARLSDPANDEGNLFNGSNNIAGGTHNGVDIDTFDLGPTGLNVLQTGDTSMTLRIGSGDGIPDIGQGGSGELAFLGWILLSTETFSPRLGFASQKDVAQVTAGPGDTLNYVLRIQNDGSDAAANVVARETAMPPGTEYIVNSTTNTCGVASGDIGGNSPLLGQGLNVGDLAVGESCLVFYSVRIDTNVAPGTTISNDYILSADNHPDVTIGPALTNIIAPQIGTVEKTVSVVGGGLPAPGATLLYTISLPNAGSVNLSGLSLTDNLHPSVTLSQIISIPPGSVDNSDLQGGTIQIDSINVPINESREVVYAANINADTPIGTQITNQGIVSAPAFQDDIVSDDPLTAAVNDATVISVVSDSDIGTSTKEVFDVTGDPNVTLRGDTLDYVISVVHSGTVDQTVLVVDDLPAFVEDCQIEQIPANSMLSCAVGGANGTGQITGTLFVPAGSSVTAVFSVRVRDDAPDQQQIINEATLIPAADPASGIVVTSGALEVFARPDFSSSTKSVTVPGGTPQPLADLTYTIDVQNTGVVDATNLVVTDILDDNLSFVSSNPPANLVGNTLTFSLPQLAVNETQIITVQTQIVADAQNGVEIINQAEISADAPANDFVTNQVSTTVVTNLAIGATKTFTNLTRNDGTHRPGDQIEYSVRVENTGTGALSSVDIRDPVSELFFDTSTITFPNHPTARLEGNVVIFDELASPNLFSLAVGGSESFEFRATLRSPLANGSLVSNQAVVTSVDLAEPVFSDFPDTPAVTGDPTVFNITSAPELFLDKVARNTMGQTILDGDTVNPGDTVEYFFTLSNDGDANARNINVVDPLPAEVTFISSSTGGVFANGTVTFSAATNQPLFTSLGTNATINFGFTVRVNAPLSDGTIIDNRATVSADGIAVVLSDDPNTPDPLDETSIEVQSGADLTDFNKTFTTNDIDGDGEISPGDEVRYILSFSNQGDANAQDVVITDAVPDGLTIQSASSGGQVAGNTITWDSNTTAELETVSPGGAFTVVIDALLNRPLANNTSISNQAQIVAQGTNVEVSDDPTTVANNDATVFSVVSHPILNVTKTANPSAGFPVSPGDQICYTITLENSGGRAATGITITDVVDPLFGPLSLQNNGVFDGNTITWALTADIDIDTTTSVGFCGLTTAPIDNGTIISNQAVVSTSEANVPGFPVLSDDPNLPGEFDTTDVQMVSGSDLSSTTLTPLNTSAQVIDSAIPGATITYQLQVRNDLGLADAENVTVSFIIPDELTVVSGGTVVGNTLSFDSSDQPELAVVSPGQVVTIEFDAEVASPLANGTEIVLQAALSADDTVAPFSSDDPSTAAFGDPTVVTVQSAADLSGIQKSFLDIDASDDGNIIEPGDFVQYTIRVRNTGNGAATNVVVRDPLPAGTTFSVSSTGGVLIGNEIVFDQNAISNLSNVESGGEDVLLRFTVRVNDNVPDNTLVSNQAFVSADGLGESPSDDPDTVAPADATSFVVQRIPRLTFTKDLTSSTSSNDRVLQSGDAVLYTFVIEASGTSDLQPSVFTDTLPENLINVTTIGTVSYDSQTRVLSANLPALSQGETESFVVAAEVAPGTSNGTVLENQAQINSPDLGIVVSDDPQTAQSDDATLALVSALADLTTSTKTATDENDGLLVPGDTIRYVISIFNTGGGDAVQVQVTDVVDTTSLEVVDVENGGVLAGNTIVWESSNNPALNSVGASQSVELAFTARVRGEVANGTEIFNQASIGAQGLADNVLTDDPSTPDVIGDSTRVQVLAPTITFTKTFADLTGDETLRPGDQVRYQIAMQNGGTAASTSTTLSDVIPLELKNPEAVNGTIAGGVATWTLGDIEPGGFVAVELTGQIDELAIGGTEISNRAELYNDEFTVGIPSDDPSTPDVDATVRMIEASELYEGTVELLDAETNLPIVSDASPGDRIRIRITFAQSGTQTGQAVVLRIPFNAAQFALQEAGSGGIVNENEMQWDASQLADLQIMRPGDEVTVEAIGTIQSPIPDGITIDVRGEVSSGTSVGETWVIGPEQLTIDSYPKLDLSTKEVTDDNGGLVEPGDILTYRMTIINDGGAEATNVVVQESVPVGTSYLVGTTQVAGVPVSDDGLFPMIDGLNVGDVSSNRSLVVSFQVRVHVETVVGTQIGAQAMLRADGTNDFVTDNPATPLILGDPTYVVVGGGGLLVAQKSASVGSISAGETLTYQIAIENSGNDTVRDIILSDELILPISYVAETIRVDGLSVTDGNDGDAAVFIDGDSPRIEVRRDVINPGEGMLITFDVEAVDGPRLSNQASIVYNGNRTLLTDADPLLPGAQRLITPVQNGRALLVDENTSMIRDGNGDVLEAGDPLDGWTFVKNRSLEAVRVTALTIGFGALYEFDFSEFDLDTWTWDEEARELRLNADAPLTIQSGETFSLRYPGQVSDAAERGDTVRIVADAEVETEDGAIAQSLQLGQPSLTVGLMEGTGEVSGSVYFDDGESNQTYDPDTDRHATGFQVLAFLSGSDSDTPVRTAVTNKRGQYALNLLPEGAYRFELRSESGALFREENMETLESGEIREEHLRIDPSGVIYHSRTHRALGGTRVFLYVDDGDTNLDNDTLVPEDQLLDGQQGQLSTAQGLYRFDPFPGEYRIGLEPLDLLYGFPSQRLEPEGFGVSGHPFGAVAQPDENGLIVPDARPSASAVAKYYLRFSLSTDRPPVLNNHIPLDAIKDQISITKTANRKKVSIGDLLAYTVRIENQSGGEISLSDGGVEIVDTLPAGFRLVDGSWRLDRIEKDAVGQQSRTPEDGVQVEGKRTLQFSAFALEPNTSYELRYQVVVGPGRQFGVAENHAALRLAEGQVPLSETVTAAVRVIPDPLFDLGSLRGKVYCDTNEDHFQDEGEDGLPGARVYLDTGYFADADLTGKFHFTGIVPGTHLAKLDPRTLPPGSQPLEGVRKNFYISGGLPAQIDFPVRCERQWIGQPMVNVNEDAYRPAPPNAPITYDIELVGDLKNSEAYLGAHHVPGGQVALGLAPEGEELQFEGPGPNVELNEEGKLKQRLVFAPRVNVNQNVLAWRVSVQEETGELPPEYPEPLMDEELQVPHAQPLNTVEQDDGGIHDGGDRVDAALADQNDAGSQIAMPNSSSSWQPESGVPGFITDGGVMPPPEGAKETDAGSAMPGVKISSTETTSPSEQVDNLEDAGHLTVDGGATELAATPKTPARTFTPVYAFGGVGLPPQQFFWNGLDTQDGTIVLENGKRYGFVLSVVVGNGDAYYSPVRPVGVGFGESEQARGHDGIERQIDETGGPLFDMGDILTTRGRQWLEDVAPSLKNHAGPIRIRVHTDDGEEAESRELTQRQAEAAKRFLEKNGISLDRMQADGVGVAEPLFLNFIETDRQGNRRIEIRIPKHEVSLADVPPSRWPGRVWINEREIELKGGSQLFSTMHTYIAGEMITLEMQTYNGGRVRIHRILGPEGVVAHLEGLPDEKTSKDISGNVETGQLQWGEETFQKSVTSVRLKPQYWHPSGAAWMKEKDVDFELLLDVVMNSGQGAGPVPSWANWTLEVLDVTPESQGISWQSETSFMDAFFMDAQEEGETGMADSPADTEAGEPADDPLSAMLAGLGGESAPPEADAGPDAGQAVAEALDGGIAPQGQIDGGVFDSDAGAFGQAGVLAGNTVATDGKQTIISTLASDLKRAPSDVLFRLQGQGAPPDRLVWDGYDQDGNAVVSDGRFFGVRLLVETTQGEVGVSPVLPVGVALSTSVPMETEILLALEDVAKKKTILKASAVEEIEALLPRLMSSKGRIEVRGYTHSKGSRRAENRRADKIANQVKAVLVKLGVETERIEANGFGSADPVASNKKKKTRKRNNRFEIILEEEPIIVPPMVVPAELVSASAEGLTFDHDGVQFFGKTRGSSFERLFVRTKKSDGSGAAFILSPETLSTLSGRPQEFSTKRQSLVDRLWEITQQEAEQRYKAYMAEQAAQAAQEAAARAQVTDGGTEILTETGGEVPLSDAGSPEDAGSGLNQNRTANSGDVDGGTDGPVALLQGDAGQMNVTEGNMPDGGATDAAVEVSTIDAGEMDEPNIVQADGGVFPLDATSGDAGPTEETEQERPESDYWGDVAYQKDGVAPAWWPSPAQVPAKYLRVQLPPPGVPFTGKTLLVKGETAVQNQVLINGHAAVIDEDTGEFSYVVQLPEGPSTLTIETIDIYGNRGRIEREVQVDTSGWFALFLADTAVGWDGAQLDERSSTTSMTLGDFFVYGRGVAYVKGQFQGPYFFRDYDFTLHFDSRRFADETFVRDVFDPELLYPVYGDSSIEVQDARARYPLFVRLKADDSSFAIGNFKTELNGGELFRYHRTRYGAQLHFDRGWTDGLGLDLEKEKPRLAASKDPWRTQVKGFLTGSDDSTRHARVELLGTGSSVYFLRHEDVVEGSERVFVIVRDTITGAEIARVSKSRNLDYIMRYPEGRLVMNAPVPAFADSSFLVNHNLGQVSSGHRVSVEVEYDHESIEPMQGWAAGGRFDQLILGHMEVGGGYLYESREDGSAGYQLGGMNAKLFLDEGTYVNAEFALSRSVDAGNFFSTDGGLTYRNMGQTLDANSVQVGTTVYPATRQGYAFRLDSQVLFGNYLGQKSQDGLTRAYFHRQSPGFFSGSNIVEQGQWKWGTETRWKITKNDLLRFRYDGIVSEIPEIPQVTESRLLNRQIATLGYERQIIKSLRAGIEYGYGYTGDSGYRLGEDDGESNSDHMNVGALSLDWQVLRDLKLGMKQEIILTGDNEVLFLSSDGEGQLDSWNDHFITHLNFQYDLTESLALTGSESLRWNGENQTSLGLSWKVNENARVYTSERLNVNEYSGVSSTMIIGGESQVGQGTRTYAEYQLQSGFAGQQSRGVMGLSNRWKLPFGFTLNFGYERVQVIGGNVTSGNTNVAPPGAFTDGTFYAAPGANGGGDYLFGAGSRDAASAGVEWKRGDTFLLSQRFELRYDNFDETRGGADRLWFLSMSNALWRVNPSLSMLARYNIGLAYDLTRAQEEAHMEEGNIGFAYRPVDHDWLSVWAKLSRKVDVRPISLLDGLYENYTTHAVSVEPIVELPWKFQLVEKLALKHVGQIIGDLPQADAFTLLWINRLNWHALGTVRSFGVDPLIPGDIDFGVEYRVLSGITAQSLEHGFLFEVQYAPLPYLRMGLGWNFTRFSDNELDRNDTDHSGFFIRAVGQY